MSFFKDFKDDFTQAMNELMPDGNEVYDEIEDEEQEAVSEVLDVPKEKPVKEKQVKEKPVKQKPERTKPKEKKKKIEEDDTTNMETSVQEMLDELQKMNTEEKHSDVPDYEEDEQVSDSLEIAPEDMSEGIDDLLNHELYGDEQYQSGLIRDDVDVDTMDMSVEELLRQLDAASQTDEQTKLQPEEVVFEPDDNEFKTAEDIPSVTEDSTFKTAEDILNDMLSTADDKEFEAEIEDSITDAGQVTDDDSSSGENEMDNELEEVFVEDDDSSLDEADVEPEQVLVEEEIIEEPEQTPVEEEIMEEPEQAPATEEVIEETEQALDTEPITEEPEEVSVAEPVEEEITQDASEELSLENIQDNADESLNQASEEVSEEPEEAPITEEVTEEPESDEIEVEFYEENVVANEITNSIVNVEDENMENENKKEDVISIKSVEEKPAADASQYNTEEADSETTYITKGTVISGNIDTDGSIDVIGAVEGDMNCKGKVVVGGSIKGSVTAGELYCNSARIEGDIKSYGSVKVGVGSMIIGNIEGDSAVIAGAVNGDIDVKGPVIVDSTAVIMGNIKSRSVQINNGAVIEGFCSQSYSDIDVKSFFA